MLMQTNVLVVVQFGITFVSGDRKTISRNSRLIIIVARLA